MAGQAYSYADVSIKEDLWDQIKDIEPLETYVTSHAGTVEVAQKVHSWINDPITATSSVPSGTVEGADTSYSVTDPSLAVNYTQIIEKGIKVPMTTENSKHAGFDSRFAREQVKKMKEWKNDFEAVAVAGTIACGNASTARTAKGIAAFASTLATTLSGVSLSSAMYNAYMGDAWDQGADISTVLVGRQLKERISGFTTSNTRNIDASDKRIVNGVDIYESDNGVQKIIKHRYVGLIDSTASVYELVGYVDDYIKIGFLDPVHFEERPKSGYYKAGSIVGEGTIQVSNEKAVVKIIGLK